MNETEIYNVLDWLDDELGYVLSYIHKGDFYHVASKLGHMQALVQTKMLHMERTAECDDGNSSKASANN